MAGVNSRPFLMTESAKDNTEQEAPAGAAVVSKRLTPREYARAKSMWQSGEYSLAEIADAVGVSATALSRRFKRDSIEKGATANKVSAAVQKAIERTSAAQAEEMAVVAHDLKMQALKAIKLFNQKAYADVAKSIQDKTPLAERLSDLKALNEATKIVAQNYATGAKILGLDQELNEAEDLPELQIHLMTENDVADLREQQRREQAEANGENYDDEEITGGLTEEELAELDGVISEGAAEPV